MSSKQIVWAVAIVVLGNYLTGFATKYLPKIA